MEDKASASPCGYVALDIHKCYSAAAGMAKHFPAEKKPSWKEKTGREKDAFRPIYSLKSNFQLLSSFPLGTEVNGSPLVFFVVFLLESIQIGLILQTLIGIACTLLNFPY